jgi:hypothetical protein
MNSFTIMAKGGGCFLGETPITTINGLKRIRFLHAGDRIISFNEETGKKEVAVIGKVDVLKAHEYFVINNSIKTTASHPFYTTQGIKNVDSLRMNDYLVGENGRAIEIHSIVRINTKVVVYNLINVSPHNNYYAAGVLVHNKGGGRGSSSGGSRGSSSKDSGGAKSIDSKTSSTSTNGTSTSSKTPAGKSTAKPGDKVKTSSGKEVQTSNKKPTNNKYTQPSGVVGDNGYSPRFANGYSAPEGSVVYRREHDFVDYLPWVYLFSQDSPRNDHVTVIQPDGKEVTAPPAPEGVDGLAIFNWFVLIIIALAIIGGVMYGVYKWVNRK